MILELPVSAASIRDINRDPAKGRRAGCSGSNKSVLYFLSALVGQGLARVETLAHRRRILRFLFLYF